MQGAVLEQQNRAECQVSARFLFFRSAPLGVLRGRGGGFLCGFRSLRDGKFFGGVLRSLDKGCGCGLLPAPRGQAGKMLGGTEVHVSPQFAADASYVGMCCAP